MIPIGPTVREEEQAKRIAKLEAALAWYADGDMYLRRGLASEFEPLALLDGGAIARQAVPDMSTAAERAAERKRLFAQPATEGPDAIIVSVRLKKGGFESSIEVPITATKEEFDNFAKQWMAMMLAGVQLGTDLRNRD